MKTAPRHKVTVHLPWNGEAEEGLVARPGTTKSPWSYQARKRKGTEGQPEWVVHWTLRMGSLKPIREGLGRTPIEARMQAGVAADEIAAERGITYEVPDDRPSQPDFKWWKKG